MAINAILFPIFQPAMRIIASITQSNPAIVTTTFDNQYETGLVVRILIAPGGGMEQIDQKLGDIVVIDATSFYFPIDSTNFDAFVVPSSMTPQKYFTLSQVVPVGEINSTVYLATRNILVGP